MPWTYNPFTGKFDKVVKGFNALDPAVFYRIWRMVGVASTPRTATVSSVSGDVVTLTANVAYKFYDTLMSNACYVKIANTSRGEYAWVKDVPAANQLQVTDAADIAAWVNGNTISTAEDGAASTKVEVDISPAVGATDVGNAFLGITLRDSGAAGYGSYTYSDPSLAANEVAALSQVANVYIVSYGVHRMAAGNKVYIRDIASGAATITSIIVVNAYTD